MQEDFFVFFLIELVIEQIGTFVFTPDTMRRATNRVLRCVEQVKPSTVWGAGTVRAHH